ncbi:MAG: J domain-containing protein [Chloroflexi bacterium]|nr:J domain-containing protein [Chloroflexota bacterium]
MHQSVILLKRKLRQLKKIEIKIRFGGRPSSGNPRLIWNVFFSTKNEYDRSVKYPLSQLAQMDRQELKQVFDEYFYRIYFQNYREKGLTIADVYDSTLLSLLGLPPYAGIKEIKTRFRELAKRYHPDHGGDSEKFIELVEIREKLTNQQR